MNVVLLSGGSGKRLWPLSNEANSKQFLKLLPGPDGTPESMVQRVYRQLMEVHPGASVTVSTNEGQADAIRRQLGDGLDIVVEPERRNTYPAILLACAHLFWQKGLGRDEAVIVLPIDPFTERGYFTCLGQMEQAVSAGAYNMVLMGARPTYPSEKYGYILPKQYEQGTVMAVDSFREKPDLVAAEALMAEGALWNGGVFAFRLGYMMDLLQKEHPAGCYDEVLAHYGELTRDSFDYAVVEKEPSIGMVEYVGKWKDLGTWNTLTEEMGRESVGPDVFIADSCNNTHVLNMLDVPIVAMGLTNAVVVASHDGVLVSDKHQSSYLKPFADQITQRPMYEQRRWGDYRVLDYTIDVEGNATLTKRMHVRVGGQISYQRHKIRTETWTITKGEGLFYFNDEKRTVKRGEVLIIPPGAKHAIEGVTDLEFIEVQMGKGELEEADVERLAVEW